MHKKLRSVVNSSVFIRVHTDVITTQVKIKNISNTQGSPVPPSS